jgi:hypothetical protein
MAQKVAFFAPRSAAWLATIGVFRQNLCCWYGNGTSSASLRQAFTVKIVPVIHVIRMNELIEGRN